MDKRAGIRCIFLKRKLLYILYIVVSILWLFFFTWLPRVLKGNPMMPAIVLGLLVGGYYSGEFRRSGHRFLSHASIISLGLVGFVVGVIHVKISNSHLSFCEQMLIIIPLSLIYSLSFVMIDMLYASRFCDEDEGQMR